MYWLATVLFVLLLSSPALGSPTTPNDPFHDILKLAARLPEPPICCLKPLPSNEPAEEILSFEDWKAKQVQLQQAEGPSGRDATRSKAPVGAVSVAEAPSDAPADAQPSQASADPPAPPHFRVPLTDRFNYASLDCSARVHTAHRAAKSPASILSAKKDRYMLSPCRTPGDTKFVVVELCEDIRIDTVQLANFEFFSGVFKEFSVSVARTYSTDPEGWTPAGMYRAKNIRGVQSFHPPTSLRDFYRFIRIDFHSNYGNEYYCPVSLLRVFGLTHLEQWKWDVWEAESQAKRGEMEGLVLASALSAPSNVVPGVPDTTEKEKAVDDSMTAQNLTKDSSEVDSSMLSTEELQPTSSDTSSTSAMAPMTVAPSTSHDTSALAASASSLTSQPDTQKTFSEKTPVVMSSSDSGTAIPSVAQSLVNGTPPHSESAMSSVPPPSEPSQLESSLLFESPIAPLSAPSLSASLSKPGSLSPSPPSALPISASVPLPTIVPHEVRAVPAVTSAGESIYRTIMTRLSSLEANSTLYLRYVEEQTRSMRDALKRLEEDVGRLEGIGKAHAQLVQKTMHEWERQRKRLEREHGELLARVTTLADAVVLEQRLGVAQLCLLLAVLVIMALTRGSRGEAFVVSPSSLLTSGVSGGRRDSLRAWGRRHFSTFGSGEWVEKLRGRSPTPTKEEFRNAANGQTMVNDDRIKFPSPRQLSSSERTPRREPTTTVPSSSGKSRTPAHLLRTPHTRHLMPHRPGTPTFASYAGYSAGSHVSRSANLIASGPWPSAPATVGLGASAARPRLRRSSSHNAPAGGMMSSLSAGALSPLSTRKWAKSAHLHEIRRVQGPVIAQGSPATPRREEAKRLGFNALSEGGQSPTKENESGASKGGKESNEGTRRTNGSVFWQTTPASDGGMRGGAGREPLTPLQNRTRDDGRARDCEESTPQGLGSPWRPESNGRRVEGEAETETESWVDTDTDVEGSEGGDIREFS